MNTLLGCACNFFGEARETMETLRKPFDEQNRSNTTKFGIELKPYKPPPEFIGTAEKELWEALGLKLSWKKGSLGDTADWIGAEISLKRGPDGAVTHVTVTIAKEKSDKIQAKVGAFLIQTTVKR